jgi:hypothetical protein
MSLPVTTAVNFDQEVRVEGAPVDYVLLPSGLDWTFLCVSEPAVVAIARPLTRGVGGPAAGIRGSGCWRDDTVIRVGWVLIRNAIQRSAGNSGLSRTRLRVGAPVRYDDVRYPDQPAACRVCAPPVRSDDRC